MIRSFLVTLTLAAVFAVPSFAQGPDGSDVNQSIPIYFGQTVDDILDANTGPVRLVYKIVLARGQKLNVNMTAPIAKRLGICLIAPGTISVKTATCLASAGNISNNSATHTAANFSYDVAAAGTYYIQVNTFEPSSKFQLQVTAQGTPIAVPNPATAGCLSGPVNSITYSLQLIAAGLADDVTIGGQKACASCTVKAPLYTEIVSRLEYAMKARVNVEACYDSSGNIFQIKLVQP